MPSGSATSGVTVSVSRIPSPFGEKKPASALSETGVDRVSITIESMRASASFPARSRPESTYRYSPSGTGCPAASLPSHVRFHAACVCHSTENTCSSVAL
jgi:hypothetical protein